MRVPSPVDLALTPSAVALCDVDGGASLLERATGALAVRAGVGPCGQLAARPDGSVAVAAEHETVVLGPAHTPPRDVVVTGTVTLDGAPAAGLPVLVGVATSPASGSAQCPELPPYATCVRADRLGHFRATVRALGAVPVAADVAAAAARSARPRIVGTWSARTDGTAPVVLDLRSAEPEY